MTYSDGINEYEIDINGNERKVETPQLTFPVEIEDTSVYPHCNLDTWNRLTKIKGKLYKCGTFPSSFSNKIKSIDPTIYYNLKNPPIPIPNKSRVLLAVHIPISSSRPHMVSSTGRFYYRTNGGNRIMNYNEVKKEFLTFEERRYKLNLFYIEIIGNLKIAEQMVRLANREINTATGFLSYSTLKFETTLMSSLLPDIFGIISNDQQLINSLLLLKLQMSPINTAIDVFHSYAPNIEQMKNQLGTHNDYINLNVRNRTLPLLRTIKEGLELRYNLTSPISDTDFLDF